MSSIEEEAAASPYSVISINLNFEKLQTIYGQGNLTSEYAYLVSPSTYNYDDNNGSYYQYTAIVHPNLSGIVFILFSSQLNSFQIRKTGKVKQTIIELEFANSTNAAQEILEYKN